MRVVAPCQLVLSGEMVTPFEALSIAMFAVLAACLLWIIFVVFRKGLRSQYLSDGPYFELVLYTFGTQLLIWLLDWVRGNEDSRSIMSVLAVSGALFLLGFAIWLVGFEIGRASCRAKV